jgi:hypothetical protein
MTRGGEPARVGESKFAPEIGDEIVARVRRPSAVHIFDGHRTGAVRQANDRRANVRFPPFPQFVLPKLQRS